MTTRIACEMSSSEGSGWDWPGSLDAVVAAPEHHAVVLENDRVRVLLARVGAA